MEQDHEPGQYACLLRQQRNYFRKDAIYYNELVARLSGPVVAELGAAFITDWYSESGVDVSLFNSEASDQFLVSHRASFNLSQVKEALCE